MLSIDECWAVLEAKVIDGLPAGASREAIRNAESIMRVEFPDDFRKLLLRHNGNGGCRMSPYKIGGGHQEFMPIRDIISTWKSMVEIGADFERDGEYGEQSGPIKQNYWNKRWIPFAENVCGDNIFLDLDPDEDGTLGQVVDWWHEGGVSSYQSRGLREWLNEVAAEVHAGVYQFDAPSPGSRPWNFKVAVFDNVSARLGAALNHPDIKAAGLTIRIDGGPSAGRSIALQVHGQMYGLCEFEIVNGDKRTDSYSFPMLYPSDMTKKVTLLLESEFGPKTQLIVKLAEA